MIAALVFTAALGPGPLPPDFVYLHDVAPAIVQDIRYAGAYNFMGSVVPGYEAAECILTAKAAEALRAADAELALQGLGLIVWDCYRPKRAVEAFMAWTRQGPDAMKPVFYPNVDRADLVANGYIAARSGHSGGGVVDLGLAPQGYAVPPRSEPARACTEPQNDGLPDMGTAYDCFDPHAALAATASPEAIANRALLTAVMERHGFSPYAAEWWHFRFVDQPHAGAAFDVPITARP